MNYGRHVVERTIEELGIELTEDRGEWGVGLCPLHGDSSPSFEIHLSEGGWVCFAGCGSSGDLAYLVSQLTGEKLSDARLRLRQGVPVDDESFRNALQSPQERAQRPVYVDPDLDYIRGKVPRYMLSRGFTTDVLKAWDVGWDPELKAVVIPVKDTKGDVLGLVRRILNPGPNEGKYKNTAGMAKAGLLFGIDHVPKEVMSVAIVEGPLDCMWLHQHGIPAVALLGATMAEGQADAILRRFWSVTLAFDADKAGELGLRRARQFLSRIGVRVVSLPPGVKDVQECDPEVLTALFSS